MQTARPILNLHEAMREDIADLVTRRPVPAPGLDQIGAFLFLNHHGPQTYPPGNRGLPFGPHPHRGFETVTFILEGNLAHRDSAGHESIIHAGGVQWMTAGSGLVHAEISPDSFKRDGGPLEILQLWVNLPARLKMTPPRYTGLQKADIPRVVSDAGRVTLHLISGDYQGVNGPVPSLTGVFMTTLELKTGGRIVFDDLAGRDVFCYVVRGDVAINGSDVNHFHLVEFGPGDLIDIEAIKDSVLLFGHAAPIPEPVVAHGPFVMNTVAEIQQAYNDYQAGKFG
jgi:redox-sensitive bicupin YhaK (pirin superfamily)